MWAPGIEGGVVLSLRGGDFKIESGQDLSIGYLDHDADVVRLYLEESLNFRVLEPDAAVAIRSGTDPHPRTAHDRCARPGSAPRPN